ncbi:hypothetical protein FSP39_015964 [Pinctada imbricata]|uniref:Tyr recombinase domain-containing protein n=1 Tax=Pinctada imbricata TaxID=66713 RepID=A0AA88XGC0_PINIB|nr:hypothetical protein FSP39_015964 [Pinctada imbricata]
MKGIYNKIPPKPKYQQIWDLDKVLSYLNSLETNDKLHIKVLSKKLAFLLAVVSPKRVSEISRLNTEFMKYSDTGVIFELPGLSKTQSSSKPKQVKYDAYPENPQLCVVSCIKTYCARTESKRDNSNRGYLLIMNRKPYASISAQTVSHWIRDIMGLAGIDTSKFKAHSARAASTSKASNAGVPIEEILSMADWSSQSIFVKFYRKVVTPHSYGKSVLRTCYAGGARYNETGGAADYLCLPPDPDLTEPDPHNQYEAYVWGAEFEGSVFASDSHNKDVPCVVCRLTTTTTQLMIPAKSTCYQGWTFLYSGHLASSSPILPAAGQYVCVDGLPEYVPRGDANLDGKLFYPVAAKCGSLLCPPYKENFTLKCVVCSK